MIKNQLFKGYSLVIQINAINSEKPGKKPSPLLKKRLAREAVRAKTLQGCLYLRSQFFYSFPYVFLLPPVQKEMAVVDLGK